MFSAHASVHGGMDETISTEPAGKQHWHFWPKIQPRLYIIAFSLALNIGFCTYMASQWLAPVSPYRTPEERMQIYSQYLPEAARAEYRERISTKIATLLEIHKQVHAQRQAIADLLTQEPLDKAAIYTHFQTIRDMNQKIGRIYQEALVEVEASLPVDERMKSRAQIASFIKRDQPSAQ